MNTRIRKLRKTLDLTQREFGERIGIKANTVTMIEKGRSTSEQTIQAICREFRVNETWLRTGGGDMFLPPPRDALDDLVEQRGLPREFRSLIDKFLDLKPDQQEAVIEYMRSVATAFIAEGAAADPAPWAAPPDAAARQAQMEQEVDQEVERYRQQLLSEKLRESQALFVRESGAG